MAQFRLCHWSTRVGRFYGDVCIFSKYSEKGVKLEKIGQPDGVRSVGHGGEGESLALSKETIL